MTWLTSRWANIVFSFFLAVTEINAYLAFNYFLWRKLSSSFVKQMVHQFRNTLANELIYNVFLEDSVTYGVEKGREGGTRIMDY